MQVNIQNMNTGHYSSKKISFDDYRTCLFDGETIYWEEILFENRKYEFSTVNKNKIALNRQ